MKVRIIFSILYSTLVTSKLKFTKFTENYGIHPKIIYLSNEKYSFTIGKITLVDKLELVVKPMRWKAHLYENNSRHNILL